MTVEYSDGYKEQAAKRLEEYKKNMTPHAWMVSMNLAEAFKKCSTIFENVSVTSDDSRHPESTKNKF